MSVPRIRRRKTVDKPPELRLLPTFQTEQYNIPNQIYSGLTQEK